MRFKLDENLPLEAVHLLRQSGHDATSVMEQSLSGSADSHLASLCRRENRALVPLDVGFGDIRAYPPAEQPGFVVLRLKRQDKYLVLEAVRHLMRALAQEPLNRHLWIVEETQIRIRG